MHLWRSTTATSTLALRRVASCLFAMAVLGGLLAGGAMDACAQARFSAQMPEGAASPTEAMTEGVDIEEHLNAQLPLDAKFRDHDGRDVVLGDLFEDGKPVILTLNYSDCPMLCSLQLDGLVEALQEVDLDLGKDYRIVTVSIDPKESPTTARQTMQKYVAAYGKATDGWRFLVGRKGDIDRVAETTGFGYRYVPATGEYAHAAVAMVCMPDGRISRYLYGVRLDPKTVRLSLVEASAGKVGNTIDRFILMCFQYDPESGSYAFFARNLMKVGGALTVLVLGAAIFMVLRRERTRERLLQNDEEAALAELQGGTTS